MIPNVPLYKPVVCKDGFTLSVQASWGHYCTPRDNSGPYTHVEVGFPSEPEPLLSLYAESLEDPTGTVYPYVPSAVLLQVIAMHGGVDKGEIPPLR